MKDIKMQLPKVTLDDLFTTQEERDNKNMEKVIEIPIKEISDFPNPRNNNFYGYYCYNSGACNIFKGFLALHCSIRNNKFNDREYD